MPAPIRIVTWNILEGFHRPGTTELDDARLERARRVIANLRPDILVLNEALWCEPVGGHFVDYAEIFGFQFAHHGLYDGAWGNVVLSHHPVRSVSEFRIYNRGGLRMTLENGLTICTYHPHPGRYPGNKAADFTALVDGADGPLALCGDFNAIHPDDEPDRPALERGFRRFSKSPASDVARFIDGGQAVFSALSSKGLRDAIPPAGRAHTVPTDMLSEDKGSAMRLDHIMVNDQVIVLRGGVISDPDAEAASDHRPVMAEIAFR